MSEKTKPYECKLSAELQERALKELNEQPARRAADIEALRQWMLKQPHIKGRTDDEFLLKFLRNCKFSIERAKEKIDNYYTMKGALPQWFTNRTLDDPVMKHFLTSGVMVPLGYDNLGRKILLGRTGGIDPAKVKPDQMMRFNSLLMDYMLMDEQTQICGVVIINDLAQFTGAHVTMFSPSDTKKMMMAWQDCLPIRTKGIHYYNVPGIFDALFSLFKLFLKKKLLDRVNFHGSKLESLQAAIGIENLPKEYGGTAGCLQDYIDEMNKGLLTMKDYYKEEDAFTVDESKRVGKSKTYEDLFGMEGTFRKLDID